jgi:hypothetical protein
MYWVSDPADLKPENTTLNLALRFKFLKLVDQWEKNGLVSLFPLILGLKTPLLI